jgi:hypothetical protein
MKRTEKDRKTMSVAKRAQNSPELEYTPTRKSKRYEKSKSSAGLGSTLGSDPYDADVEDNVGHQTASFGI